MTWKTFLGERARDTMFDVAIHVAWADGRLFPSEVIAVQALAGVLELGTQDLGRAFVGRRAREIDTAALSDLSPLERPLTYAIAAWVAWADGRNSRREGESLDGLVDALELDDPLVMAIDRRIAALRLGVGGVSDHARALDGLFAATVELALRSHDSGVIALPVGEAPRSRRSA